MGKIITIIVGSAVAVLGIILLLAWFKDFVLVLKGTVPAFMVLGGVIALIAGISELKDSLKTKSEENK